MNERLESESRIAAPEQVAVGGLLPAAQASVAAEMDGISKEIDDDTKMLISRCMDGTEVPSRPLRPWEQQSFNPTNIQAVLLRSAGFKHHEIASLLGIDKVRVSITCAHPYGLAIIAAMMKQQAGRVIDIKTRLEQSAGEMLEKMMQMAAVETDLKIVQSVTFGLLDRSGYGPTQKIEATAKRSPVLEPSNIARLANALDESKRVDSSVMQHFVQKAPPMDSPNAPGAPNRDSFEFIESDGAHRTGTDP